RNLAGALTLALSLGIQGQLNRVVRPEAAAPAPLPPRLLRCPPGFLPPPLVALFPPLAPRPPRAPARPGRGGPPQPPGRPARPARRGARRQPTAPWPPLAVSPPRR